MKNLYFGRLSANKCQIKVNGAALTPLTDGGYSKKKLICQAVIQRNMKNT
jgi:hypothetical protein